MRFLIYALLCLIMLPASADDGLIEGKDYLKLNPPQPVRVPAGKIEVREFFNYSCPHCFRLQGHLAKWRAEHEKEDVAFVHQPLVFARYNGHFARVYYTLQALKLEDDLHSKIYTAIHEERQLINSKGRFTEWLEEQGADSEQAEKVYDSFTVQTRANLALTIADDYAIDSTPQISINGKYIVNPGISRSYEQMLKTLTALIERERQAQ